MGPYEVTAAIGAGGMGEVYRAHDTRLQRDVAIKVLPASFANDPDRRARFEQEAQAIAALSHPNVLAIFDTGTHDGQIYLVTELLEGETLRDRLKAGPLPSRKTIDTAMQIANGLAAAHDRQLIHRDLKPENVFLLKDGRVKILDFGLARAVRSGSGATETVAALTDPGTVVGTAGYMAPEQVRNEPVDARTDLFAFGAVLYEMLAGRRAFQRATTAETMTAILREEPAELAEIRSDAAPGLDRIIRHCLEKEPGLRFQSARDVAFALEALSGPSPSSAAKPAAPEPAARRGRWLIAAAALLVLGAVGTWLALSSSTSSVAACRDGVAPVAIGATTQATTDEGLEIHPAISPDGRFLAYSAGTATRMRVYIRPVGGGRTIALSDGKDAFEYQPRWSPDGNQLLYLSPTGVYIASALGGASRQLASGRVTAAAWAPDGKRILVVRQVEVSILAPDGTGERALGKVSEEMYSCDWTLHGDRIVCTQGNAPGMMPGSLFGNTAPSNLILFTAAGGPFTPIAGLPGLNQSPIWSTDGRQLYFVSNRQGPRDVYVADVAADGRLLGEPCRLTTGLSAHAIGFTADRSRLVYSVYSARANLWSLPIPRSGPVDTSGAQALTTGNQIVESVSVSPDGRWVLFDSTLHGDSEIFRMPIDGGAVERLTKDPSEDFGPVVSPDGRFLAYHSIAPGRTREIYVQPIAGGARVAVAASDSQERYPSWSPDGNAIAYQVQRQALSADQFPGGVFVIRRSGSGTWSEPVRLGDSTAGRVAWLGDTSVVVARTGGSIAILPVPPGAERVVYAPATTSPAPRARAFVVASPDGQTLYFKSLDDDGRAAIWSLPVAGGTPRLVVRFTDMSRPSIRPDLAVGGGRFFFTLEDRQADIVVAEITRRQ
jgi:Tol biopolymer transport system component